MILIGDTSGMVATFNVRDPEHDAARAALQMAGLIVVSPLVLHEVEHVVTRNINRDAAYGINDWLLAQERAGRVELATISADTLRTSRIVQNKYRALTLDLADAVNVSLAERYETAAIPTLDRRDFRAVRPLTGHAAFRLLPDDL